MNTWFNQRNSYTKRYDLTLDCYGRFRRRSSEKKATIREQVDINVKVHYNNNLRDVSV